MDQDNRHIQAVVFDLDDTLYPERHYVRSGYRCVEGYLRKRMGQDGPFAAWLWARFLAGRSAGALDDLNSHFRLALSAEQIAQLVTEYRQHSPCIHCYGGIAGLLGRLHSEYRLGLLSDGFLPAQRLKLDALKLTRFFDAAVLTEELGRDAWKPAPDGFERIREMLDVPHGCCAYVADNVAKDFVAPNRLGWRTIQLLHPGQIHSAEPAAGGKPQHVVGKWDQLRDAVREPIGTPER